MEPDSCRPDDETLEDPLQPLLPGVQVEVMVEDAAWRRFLPRAEVLARRAVAAALAGSEASGLVTVLLADDRMLRRLNDVFANRNVNISAQNYQTDGEVGYVVMEADSVGTEAVDVLREIRALDGTIRARLVYEN